MRMMTIRAIRVQRSSSGKPRMRSGLQELDTVTSIMSEIDQNNEDDLEEMFKPMKGLMAGMALHRHSPSCVEAALSILRLQ